MAAPPRSWLTNYSVKETVAMPAYEPYGGESADEPMMELEWGRGQPGPGSSRA
jgi:hypothetical protein